MVLIVAFATAQVNLSKGLMAYYPFTGNSNNPSFNNATLTADRFGNANSAYYFDGNGSYIQIPASLSLDTATAVSLSIWVKPNGFYSGTCGANYILSKGLESQTNYNVVFSDAYYGNVNGINFCSVPADTSNEAFFGMDCTSNDVPTVHTGHWYHVVYTNDGSISKLYVNDSLISASSAKITFNTNDIYLGRYFSIVSTPYWFNGVLDDIRIYNRALGADEVDSLYMLNTSSQVSVQSFTANAITVHYIGIQFSIENETNAIAIEVDRSLDSTNFIPINLLTAEGSVGLNQYNFTDKVSTDSAKAYYRLKIVNKDGSSQYSKTIGVQLAANNDQFSVYPNPAKKFIMVNGKKVTEVDIYDKLGNLVFVKKNLNTSSNLNKIKFNLSPGVYTAQLQIVGGKLVNEKIMVE